jgi:hypothetical protein
MEKIKLFVDGLNIIYKLLLAIIPLLTPCIIYIVKTFKNRKQKKYSIKRLTETIIDNTKKLLSRQFKIRDEYSNFIYRGIKAFHKKTFGIENGTGKYYYLKDSLNECRKVSDRFLKTIIENNHLLDKSEEDWKVYKNNNIEDLYGEILELMESIYNENLMGAPYSAIPEENFIVIRSIYEKQTDNMFEEMRKVSKELMPVITTDKKTLEFMINK